MVEVLPEILPLLIPIISLLIGAMIVGSIFVVHPLVKAITRVAEAQRAGGLPAAQYRQLEDRLGALETMLQRVLEEREFQRELHRGNALDAVSLQLAGSATAKED